MLLFSVVTNYFQAAAFSAITAVAAPQGEAPAALDGDADVEEVGERESRLCSASSDGPTGRQYARIKNSPREPWKCIRTKLGTDAPPGTPDCWQMGKEIGCTDIIDE